MVNSSKSIPEARKYWIVEHETRGVYMYSSRTTGKVKHHCSWTVLRSAAHRFYRIEEARQICSEIKGSYVLERTKEGYKHV